MVKKRFGWFNLILILIIIACVVLLILQNVNAITGHATSGTTISNVTIQKYLSFDFCGNLGAGVWFGEVNTLPATNLNGSHNEDGVDSASTYCVNVSNDSNTGVDFCVNASDDLKTSDLDVLGLSNETYSNFSTSNATYPQLSDERSIPSVYEHSLVNIAKGEVGYYRFYLDIPAGQESGTYNNTLYFKGLQTGTADCGS